MSTADTGARKPLRWGILLTLASALLLAVGEAGVSDVPAAAAASGSIERVALDSSEVPANSDSTLARVSSDGRYVAFGSYASNLVPGDTNGFRDIFIRDRTAGVTERVSVRDDEGEIPLPSFGGMVSDDGRYVVFYTSASGVAPGDPAGGMDVFLRDRTAGTTEIVSIGMGGAQGDGTSEAAAISSDGRYVLFHSDATNLAAGDTNGVRDVFLRDRQLGTTTRVSVNSSGAQADSGSWATSMTGDATAIIFQSEASNLGGTGPGMGVFKRDLLSGQTTLASVRTDGQKAGTSFAGAVNDDGRFVAWVSLASGVVPGENNGFADVFLRDTQLGTTELISQSTSGGAAAGGLSEAGRPSGDGRYVVFSSLATNLVTGGTDGTRHIFVRDRQTGTTELISVNGSGAEGDGNSRAPSITPDGRYVVFDSDACNLVEGDASVGAEVFLVDRQGTGQAVLLPNQDCDAVPDGSDNCPADWNPDQADIDGDGIGDVCDPQPTAPVDRVSIDVDDDATPANAGDSIGTIETCQRINNNDILDADEDSVDSLTIDVVVGPAGVPAGTPLDSFELQLAFSPAAVNVTGFDNTVFFIAILSITDSVPDSDGQFNNLGFDYSGLAPELTGDGVLTRITIEGVGSGPSVSPLTLNSVKLYDTALNQVAVTSVDGALVAVNASCSETDGDLDTVPDAADNCQFVANTGQENYDGDTMGDACDSDDDDDGYVDSDETLKDSDTLDGARSPEHCEGTDEDGDTAVDDEPPGGGYNWDTDGDTIKDCADASVDADGDTVPNSIDTDDDGDGYSDVVEIFASTDPQDKCPDNSSDDAHPLDQDHNGSFNVSDILKYKGKTPASGMTTPKSPLYSRRLDIDGNGSQNVSDILKYKGKTPSMCD